MFFSIQRWLFPDLEEELGELREKQKELVRTIELVNPEQYVRAYDLMDSSYDALEIHNFSDRLNHIPIIDNNPRRG